MKNRKLILEDGSEYYGIGFGAMKDVVCEIVFNTSMTGYQEIVSDPSYTNQGIVFSYPLIGNYGIADDDFESSSIIPEAVIVREINDSPSNFRSTRTLGELLSDNGVVGLSNVDTRMLIKNIRDFGTRRGLITDASLSVSEGLSILKNTPEPKDAVSTRSCKKKWYSRTANPLFSVVVIDCGLKKNIVRMLNKNRCNVTVVPYDMKSEDILKLSPDGVLISNGPGDPIDVPQTVDTIRGLLGHLPVFGICLGHQLIALSCGAKTYKLKFGHRGGNHPIKDTRTGRVYMTSQNHSYAVDEKSLPGTELFVSHRNLLDNTVEGLCSMKRRILSVQFHPESAPGPNEGECIFGDFISLMKGV